MFSNDYKYYLNFFFTTSLYFTCFNNFLLFFFILIFNSNAIKRKEALLAVMNHNKTGLPVGSFVIRKCEMKRADQVRTVSRTELNDVLKYNINVFRTSVIERLEYLRYVYFSFFKIFLQFQY